jgi:predicted permease
MSVLRSPSAHFAAFVRLVAYPAALIAALLPFKGSIDRTMALSLVTAASAPVAAMVTMFASKYGRDVDMSVGLVSGTTLLSMFTMPVAVSVAMAVF